MSSHKRAISSSAKDAEPPTSKPRIDESTTAPQSAPVLPEYVYVVIVEDHPAYGDSGSDIRGVYCSIEDANNCVKRIARDEYTNDDTDEENVKKGTKPDGTVFWSSTDVGEGDSAEIRIVKQKLRAPGSERAQEWLGDSDEGSAEDRDDGDDDDDGA